MKKAIIVGRTNAGKTLFMINFAEYLGLRSLYIKFEYPGGKKLTKEISINNAINYLSSSTPYKTRCLQSLDLEIPVYKGYRDIKVIDSSGLCDGVPEEYLTRSAIVQTIEALDKSDIIIHIIDISPSQIDGSYVISEIDQQLIRFGKARRSYVLLANKIDIDKNNKGLSLLKEKFDNVNIIPISALYKYGFKEVKSFVVKSL